MHKRLQGLQQVQANVRWDRLELRAERMAMGAAMSVAALGFELVLKRRMKRGAAAAHAAETGGPKAV
jgi:hypothetical protein